MPRKKDGDMEVVDESPLSPEEWEAQEPCPECGMRPGYNVTTGVSVKDGHSYICSKRPH